MRSFDMKHFHETLIALKHPSFNDSLKIPRRVRHSGTSTAPAMSLLVPILIKF